MSTQHESRRSTQQHDVHYAILSWVRAHEREGKAVSGVTEDLERNLTIRYAAPGTLIYELPAVRDARSHAVLREALCALNLTKPAHAAHE